MGGSNAWRVPLTMDDWMRQQEKRMLHEERRPQIRTASDLLGPGIAPTAIRLLDWNDDATGFNGFFWSAPGAQNTPDGNKWWMGTSFINEDGNGYQEVTEFHLVADPTQVNRWIRTFTEATPGAPRTYGAWICVSGPLDPKPKGRVGTSVYATNYGTSASSATFVDSPLAVTFTAVAGRKYQAVMTTQIRSSAASRIWISLREGSTELFSALVQQPATTNLREARTHMFDDLAPSAGSHTYKVSFALAGGTASVFMDGDPTYKNILSIYDIGTT